MMQKMMPVMMREMIPERKSRCFRPAVPTDADTGVAIRYGIDNHAIILLIRKEKRWIFFENIRYFTLSLLSE